MSFIDTIRQASLSPIAEQLARFCSELDEDANPVVLATAALLAHRNTTEGDTCLDLAHYSEKPLLQDAENQPLVTAPGFNDWQEQLRGVSFTGAPGDYQPLILDDSRLYLHRHWREEQIIAESLKTRFTPIEYDAKQLKTRLNILFGELSPTDASFSQKLAAAMALTRKLAIITGGPGTGKTTTVSKILALLLEQQPELRICLAAPTGKAAARLSESINKQLSELKANIDKEILEKLPREASTIHRLLGWQRHGFIYNTDNHLPCDCLLIDESSMVAQGLMASLLSALPKHCHIILLGDREQLASVEAGSVLGDLTGHGRTLSMSPKRAEELSVLIGELPSDLISIETPDISNHIAQLTHSFRFASGGGIGKLAYAVNTGNTNTVEKLLGENNDELGWIEASGRQPSTAVFNWSVEHYKSIFDAKNAKEALKIFESARILTALREGPWGEVSIREKLETLLQNERPVEEKNNKTYKGLPLIIRRNDQETGLFNGDTGIFWPDEDGTLMAWFPIKENFTPFSVHQLPEWQPAWALTVHRSQGSEYSNILLVLPPDESPVVTRELIYTGITRAVDHCTITGTKDQLTNAVERRITRLSGLGERVNWNYSERYSTTL